MAIEKDISNNVNCLLIPTVSRDLRRDESSAGRACEGGVSEDVWGRWSCGSSGSCVRLLRSVRLGVEVDALPLVDVGHQGVIVGVPDGGAHEGVLVHGLGVAECHAVRVHKLHHL